MKPCKITVDLYNTFRERMPEYVQYDRNVPLEITVLENGKPADLNGLFGRLLVSKPDGHEVYSNDVEINGNVITTTLGEQVFTASGVAQVTVDILDEQNSKRALVPFGMRIRSAIITDESIKSSNDYQTITALISDVRALNAMFHVEQEQRAEAFNAQMQSQEATFTEAQRQFLADHREAMFHVEQQMTEQANMFHVEQTERAKAFEQSEADREQRFEAQTTEWAQTVEQAEATRQFNEERRQSAENKRESAEKARESAERQRVDTEAVRQRQEQERGQGEAGRATAEANRVKAEQTRVDNESSRKSAESSRVNAESQRATAEGHRATAETSRVNAESQRATAETNRAGAEGRRSEAESSRVTAESGRVTAESQRVTAENTREAQENARREAEEDRATRMAQWEAKAEETAQKAQEAVDSAQAFVNTNEERLLTDRDKIDYWGNHHANMKDMTDATVDKILGDFNTLNHTGEYITATETIARHVPRGTLKGHTEVNCIQEPSGSDIVLPYDFEPGYDVTINDTKETGAVGIELQGQTLVNIVDYTDINLLNATKEGNVFTLKWGADVNRSHVRLRCLKRNLTKPNTRYVIRVNILENTAGVQLGTSAIHAPKGTTIGRDFKNLIGVSTVIMTTGSDYTQSNSNKDVNNPTPPSDLVYLGIWTDGGDLTSHIKFTVDIYEESEYHDGIPYFEGMASVTTPTVTTTGKNLVYPTVSSASDNSLLVDQANQTITINKESYAGDTYYYGINNDHLIPIEPNTKYVCSFKKLGGEISGINESDIKSAFAVLDENLEVLQWATDSGMRTNHANAKYISKVRLHWGNRSADFTNFKFTMQLERSSTITEYEPFKSSSLTLPEEITLRSLPNGVRDTYNVQTGEYVQRITDRVINGSEPWQLNNTEGTITQRFFCNILTDSGVDSNKTGTKQFLCDKLQTTAWSQTFKLGVTINGTGLYVYNASIEYAVQSVKRWLTENPITIQYELAEPIITKVPLSQVLKPWNTTTHINTSVPENSLKPIIAPVNPSYEVMLKPSTQYSIITNPIANGHTSTPIGFNLGGSTVETVIGNGCTLITTPSTLANNKLEMSGRGQKLRGGMMVLEGNKTGMAFSHFDGMKSVENPTVRVNNENLWNIDMNKYSGLNGNNPNGFVATKNSLEWTSYSTQYSPSVWYHLKLKPNKQYVLSFDERTPHSEIIISSGHIGGLYDASKVIANNTNGYLRFTPKSEKVTIRFANYGYPNGYSKPIKVANPMLVLSDTSKEYIPHQSNSLPLTIPMRSLPDGTCDTLNLLTGEYVRNIQEYTFGNESWSIASVEDSDFYHVFCTLSSNYPVPLTKGAKQIHIEGLPSTTKWPYRSLPLEAFYQYSDISAHFAGALLKSRFTANYRAEITEFMSGRKVYYQLATPIVTHLDLQWEDGKLFAYDGTTHFFVDVEGGQLMPILDIDVPVNLAQRTSRLCAEKEQLEAEKAQLANEVSVLQLRNAMLQGEVATLEQSNKDLQKGQEKLDKDNQELTHAVTIVDEHREEGDLELLSSDFDFELRLMEIEFAVGVPMMANYKGVRNMARTPYDMAKALILGGKYEREEMTIKLDRFEKLGSITADQKAELIALMDAVELTQ